MTAFPWLSSGSLSVLGTGLALPGHAIDNAELITRVCRLDPALDPGVTHRLGDRLGIRTRHLSRSFAQAVESPDPGLGNPALAARAVTAALGEAGLSANDLGYLIGHTATPAQPLPSNIAFVADELGYNGPHLELRQACVGFANALMIAFGLLAQPGTRPVAIVGSETGSLFFDAGDVAGNPAQRVNMMQMGDGAAAIILAPAGAGGATLHKAWSGSLGAGHKPGLQMVEGGSARPVSRPGALRFAQDFGGILRNGAALFHAGIAAAAHHGITLADAETIVPHQANGRIAEQISNAIGIAEARVFVNADRIGNTGSAAIWLALAQLRAGGLARGHRVLALGAEATKYLHGGFEYVH